MLVEKQNVQQVGVNSINFYKNVNLTLTPKKCFVSTAGPQVRRQFGRLVQYFSLFGFPCFSLSCPCATMAAACECSATKRRPCRGHLLRGNKHENITTGSYYYSGCAFSSLNEQMCSHHTSCSRVIAVVTHAFFAGLIYWSHVSPILVDFNSTTTAPMIRCLLFLLSTAAG